MNRKEKQIELDTLITNLLEKPISEEEKEILQTAKIQLDKDVYLPKVVQSLETTLTPLAIRQQLSPALREFYLTITSAEFKDRGLGRGFLFIGKMFFR